jgi:hypothetical protein
MSLKGKIINRTGKWKHMFKTNFSPNQAVSLDELFKTNYYKRESVSEFVDRVMKIVESQEGVDLVGFDVANPDVPREIETENGLASFEIDKDSLTPSKIASLEFNAGTKDILKLIDSTKLLSYALTMSKKKNGNKRLQSAIEKRISEIKTTKG